MKTDNISHNSSRSLNAFEKTRPLTPALEHSTLGGGGVQTPNVSIIEFSNISILIYFSMHVFSN